MSIESQRIILGPAPRAGLVFVPGYYLWTDNRFLWIDPVWVPPPMIGAIWVEPNWVYENDEWIMQNGYWRNPDPLAAPEIADDYTAANPPPEPPAKIGYFDSTGVWRDKTPVNPSPPPPPPNPEPVQQYVPPVQEPPPQETWRSIPIANGQLVLQPFSRVWYRLHVGNEPEVHVVSDFNTNNPAGVNVQINDGKQKGRKTLVYWRTPTAQTAGNIDKCLNPGNYFIVFDNPSDEQMYLNVNVSVSVKERR
jgi:hypothetical protein